MSVSCRGCDARFRVTASASWRVTRLVACPSCATPIEIRPPARSEDPGWRKMHHANVFGRTSRSVTRPELPRERPRPEGTPRFDFEDLDASVEADVAPERPRPVEVEVELQEPALPPAAPEPLSPASPARVVAAEPLREVDEDISRLLELANTLRASSPPAVEPPATPPLKPAASVEPLPVPQRPLLIAPTEPQRDEVHEEVSDVVFDTARAPEPELLDAVEAVEVAGGVIEEVEEVEPEDELEEEIAIADEVASEVRLAPATAWGAPARPVLIEDPLAPEPRRSRRFVWIGLAFMLAVIGFALGRGVERAAVPEPVEEPVSLAPIETPDVLSIPIEQARGAAVFAARYAVSFSAIASDPSDPIAQRRAIEELLVEGHVDAAARIARASWSEDPGDPVRTAQLARTLAAAGFYTFSRRVALHGLSAHPDDAALALAFNEAIRDDPALHVEPITIGLDLTVDRIRKLGGGKSISFRLDQGKATAYAFKPSQREWELGWRAEVAAYTLCEVLPCGFAIPRNTPARISREDFERLYLLDTAKQRSYTGRFDALVWTHEVGPDGVARDYLYGTAKVWTPGFVDWPIEYTEVWEPWLSSQASERLLDQPISQATWGLRSKPGGLARWKSITRAARGVPTREIARQLSNVLSFDYLTNNWDRFSTAEEFYGVNNQFLGGEFLSLDNGAAFHTLKRLDVRQRFRSVERFDAHLVRALRALSRDSIASALFPDPSDEADTRLRVFWEQRASLLERVDALERTRGLEPTLLFDASPTPGDLLAELEALPIDKRLGSP